MKKPYFPDEIVQQLVWINTFYQNLTLALQTKYGITVAEMTSFFNDKEWVGYWFNAQESTRLFGENLTAFKIEVAWGAAGVPSATPVQPAFGVAPTLVLPGVFVRALALANRIKVHADYTVADGEGLGLEGAEQPVVDVPNLKPVLTLVVPGPNTVDVGWKKNRTQGVEIWVKRGAGIWMLLAFDTTTPKYVDTHAFPVAAEVWEYKAIYHYEGAQAGQWSEVVKVTVQA